MAERVDRPAQAKLTLTKNLPVASGIGGGSADAAATLRALASLWRLDWMRMSCATIAAELGSDIPVCLASRPAFMEGRGEMLTPLATLPCLPLLLVNPGVAVPTKDVFASLGERRGTGMKLPQAGFSDLADLLRFLETTGNDLEAPALALQPVIDEVLGRPQGIAGALFTRMSGSGATCFALMSDDDGCARAAALLKAHHPGWWVQPTGDRIGSAEGRGRDIGPMRAAEIGPRRRNPRCRRSIGQEKWEGAAPEPVLRPAVRPT